MRLLKFIIILTTLTFSTLFSQTNSLKTEVTYGPISKKGKKAVFGSVFGSAKEFITTIKSTNNKKTSIKLQRFDLDMNRIKSQDINLESEGKELRYHSIFESNDQYYILLTFKNQKLRKHILFIQSINKETLTLNDDLKILDIVDYPDTWKHNSGIFKLRLSNDASKFLIFSLSPKIKSEHQTIRISVYDSTFKKIWGNQKDLPVIDKHFDVKDVRVNNLGNVFLLAKHYSKGDEVKIKHGKSNLSYKVICYNQNNQINTHQIKDDKFFAESLRIKFNKNNDLICSGYFSLDKGIINNGTYFSRLDGQTGRVITEKYSPFLKSHMNTGNDEEAPYLKRFYLDAVITFDNNETFLIGEYYREVMYKSGPELKSKVTHGNICVIKLTDSGDISWVRFIHKLQTTEKTLIYSSYMLDKRDDKTYFIYNNPVRVKRKNVNVPRVSCIDLEGNITEGNIEIENIGQKGRMIIENYEIKVLKNRETLVYYSNKKNIRMAKLQY